MPVLASVEEVVLEVRRRRRRPRYHRGARTGEGLVLKPEQCNLDQVAAEVHVLVALPALRRPQQLCRRCFPQLRAEADAAAGYVA